MVELSSRKSDVHLGFLEKARHEVILGLWTIRSSLFHLVDAILNCPLLLFVLPREGGSFYEVT